jgi:tetratricopeptide (TPR) repeat protein
LTRVIKNDPKNTTALINRSFSYAKLSKLDEAMKDIEAALKIEETPAAFFVRGVIYHAKKQADLAKKDFEKFEESKPDPKAYWFELKTLNEIRGM